MPASPMVSLPAMLAALVVTKDLTVGALDPPRLRNTKPSWVLVPK